jgi:predicted MPP superfamily phosphohydrolase
VNHPTIPQPSRLAIARRGALKLIAAGMAGAFIDARWVEPSLLSVTRRDIRCHGLPSALDGLRVGLLADFHFRPGTDDEVVQAAVNQVNRENLDLLALAGDFADHDGAVLSPLLEYLGKANSAHGVFAVMGNHDGWSSDRGYTRRLFEKAGISFLINQHSLLSIRGEILAIAGTDFVWKGKPDPARTLAGLRAETPVIAMVHEPDYFDEMTRHRDIMLQLSGHTHGGQCRVPMVGYAPAKVRFGKKYIEGEFARPGSKLFVTRGVGTTGLRVRFACPPELAILTLRAEVPA